MLRKPTQWDGEISGCNFCIVRAAPELDSPVVEELQPGELVSVAEQAELQEGKLRLRLSRPVVGWVTAKFVRRRPSREQDVRATPSAPLGKSVPGPDCKQVTDLEVPAGRRLRLFLISDVHVDHKANREWLAGCLSLLEAEREARHFDCLLLPGDVTHIEEGFAETMGALAAAFEAVFFCFGNHDIWVKGERKGDPPAPDSLHKLERVHRVCKHLGVYTSPVRLLQDQGKSKPLIMLPLWSWYHSSWDTEPDLPRELQPPLAPGARVMDYRLCKWGSELESAPGFQFGGREGVTSPAIAQYFAAHNEAWLSAVDAATCLDGGEVLTFSHFCPRLELVLEKRNCFDQHIAKVCGSTLLEEQIRRVAPRPACHVFGHTHVPWDLAVEGLRYVHWPLGNPQERQAQSKSCNNGGLLLLYDGGEWAPQQFQHWSYYYDYVSGRRPEETELAPWVSSLYARMYPEMEPSIRGMLKEAGPDGFADFFPGGLKNNDSAFFERHLEENRRWKCPPCKRAPQSFPCERPDCILCKYNAEAAERRAR